MTTAVADEHNADYDPDVVRPVAFGCSIWRCQCGERSLGAYIDPGNARAGFLAHKYGVPWPSRRVSPTG